MPSRLDLVRAAVAGQLARHSLETYEPAVRDELETRMALVLAVGIPRALDALGIDRAMFEAETIELDRRGRS